MKNLLVVLGLGLILSSCEKESLEKPLNENSFTYNDKEILDCNSLYVTKYDSLSSLSNVVLSTGRDTTIAIIMTLQYEAQIQIVFSNYKGSGYYSLSEGEVLFIVGNDGTAIDGVVDYVKEAGYINITEGEGNSFKGLGRVQSHGFDVSFSFNSESIDRFVYHNNYKNIKKYE
tara:strand:- start:37 stop:555 length:519 start_codon:yes stop_codon:yes gene_type:complete